MDKNFLDHLASEWTQNDYSASTPKEPLHALAHLIAVQNAYIKRPVFLPLGTMFMECFEVCNFITVFLKGFSKL